MAAVKGDSRDRLLDAAEQLFGAKGFEATTTREIARLAGDTLGTLSYHFQSKDQLLYAVVNRRFGDLAEGRRALYAEHRARVGGPPPVDCVVESIVTPFIERALRGGETWRRYTTLLGRMMYAGNENHYAAVTSLTDPVARECLGWLRDAVPGHDELDVGYAYQFMIGCMIDAGSAVERGRMNRLTDGACGVGAFEEICPRLVRFISAGVRELVGGSRASDAAPTSR